MEEGEVVEQHGEGKAVAAHRGGDGFAVAHSVGAAAVKRIAEEEQLWADAVAAELVHPPSLCCLSASPHKP